MTIVFPYPAPQAGDFGLVSRHGPVGRAIRIGQWLDGDGFADFEHAVIYVGDDYVVEAAPGGARLASNFKYPEVFWSTGRIPLSPFDRNKIVQAAHGYTGTPYSFLDYLALATHRLHVPAPWLKGFIETSHHMICSQLVDQCYTDAGVRLFADCRWPGDVTPADLYGRLVQADP